MTVGSQFCGSRSCLLGEIFGGLKDIVMASSTIYSGDFQVKDVWNELPTANGKPFVASLRVTVSSTRYSVMSRPSIDVGDYRICFVISLG